MHGKSGSKDSSQEITLVIIATVKEITWIK
jgi:hypothetical protein